MKTMEELHNLLVNKEITAVELVEATFSYLEENAATIGAFINTDKEAALTAAKKVDERGIDENNLLDGIPVAVKDNIVTQNGKTTAASKMLENFEAIYDATAVEKIKDAGMIIIGKTNLDEFGMGGTTETSKLQTTKNPWDTTKVPGGSSGGSAASVAAGFVPAALGTDTGGSIRQPAAYTNLVGLKPTYGAVSRYGLIAFASSLDQIGPMTHTVKDNAVLFNAISGEDAKDNTSASLEKDFTAKIGKEINSLKVGVPKEFFDKEIVDEDILNIVQKAVDELEKLGAEIIEVELPHLKYGVPAYYTIASAEASSNLQRYDGIRYGYHAEDAKSLEDLYVKTRTEGFGEEVKRRIVLGGLALSVDHYDELYSQATKVRTIIRKEFEEALDKVDILVGPSTTSVAPAFKDSEDYKPVDAYKGDLLTVPVNLAGTPALNIPVGFSNDLPVGMQLIGNYFEEDVLYQVGYAYEQATDHYQQQPNFKGGATE